jgi:hypothetical protein
VLVRQVLLAALLLLGCERSKPVPPEKAPPPVPQQLTERDTEPHGGALKGDGWVLPLDDRWLGVKAEARQRFKPEVQAWAADPVGALHVTVECRPGDSFDATARHGPQGAQFRALSDGPWLSGAVADWQVGTVTHVLARFLVVSAVCDVHAWGPGRQADVLPRLLSTAAAFGSSQPRLVQELRGFAAWLAAHGPPDAGAGINPAIAALGRAPDALLVERFTLRRQLLDVLDTTDCALVARHDFDVSPRLFARLPEPAAVRWIQVTRELLEAAQRADAGVPPDVGPEGLEALAATDPALAGAMHVMKFFREATAADVCEAEKVRLSRLLAQPAASRAKLLRVLVR